VAFVDLKRDRLILKVVLTGPPAVGKTERLDQIGSVGRKQTFGSTVIGPTQMAVLPISAEREGRPVELEIYEWHGPEKADVRMRGLFVGIDGLIYIADARQDRHVDTVGQFQFLVQTAGKTKIQRLPAVMLLGQKDEGLLRLSSFEEKLQGPTWSEKLELSIEESEPFIEALRVYGEVMLARVL
jgi:hypothetical protein